MQFEEITAETELQNETALESVEVIEVNEPEDDETEEENEEESSSEETSEEV